MVVAPAVGPAGHVGRRRREDSTPACRAGRQRVAARPVRNGQRLCDACDDAVGIPAGQHADRRARPGRAATRSWPERPAVPPAAHFADGAGQGMVRPGGHGRLAAGRRRAGLAGGRRAAQGHRMGGRRRAGEPPERPAARACPWFRSFPRHSRRATGGWSPLSARRPSRAP